MAFNGTADTSLLNFFMIAVFISAVSKNLKIQQVFCGLPTRLNYFARFNYFSFKKLPVHVYREVLAVKTRLHYVSPPL